MSRQIEQALVSLMPTFGSDLPPSLVELAESLLAQSRFKASTLRPEEEVARLYACANIACERLKTSLDLPRIQPRPPIPPRLYNNLLAHLNNVLPNKSQTPGRSATGRVRTPSGKSKQPPSSPDAQERPLPSRHTPPKAETLSRFRTPSKQDSSTHGKSTRRTPGGHAPVQLQPWVQPVIRFMCAQTSHQTLAPTILAGMETITMPGGGRTEDEWVLQNTTPLLAVLYFFVAMRVKAITSGEAVSREGYVPERKAIIALLDQARNEVTVPGTQDEEAWQEWTAVKPKDFDAAIERVNDADWLQADWYQGIADIVQKGQVGDVDMADADAADAPQEAVRRGDTMFQDRYDFLSEARRADYKVWKEAMLSKITALTNEAVATEMDTR